MRLTLSETFDQYLITVQVNPCMSMTVTSGSLRGEGLALYNTLKVNIGNQKIQFFKNFNVKV